MVADRIGGRYRAGPQPVQRGAEYERTYLGYARLRVGQLADTACGIAPLGDLVHGASTDEDQRRRELSLTVVAGGQWDLVEHTDRTGPIATADEPAGKTEGRAHYGVVSAPKRLVVPLGRPAQLFDVRWLVPFELQSAVTVGCDEAGVRPGGCDKTAIWPPQEHSSREPR